MRDVLTNAAIVRSCNMERERQVDPNAGLAGRLRMWMVFITQTGRTEHKMTETE